MKVHLNVVAVATVLLWSIVGAAPSQVGAPLPEGGTSPLADEAELRKQFGDAYVLAKRPIIVSPRATGDSELCTLLARAVTAWEYSVEVSVPTNINALAKGGHILWKVSRLRELDRSAPATGTTRDDWFRFEQEIESALLSAGPGYYWMGSLGVASSTGEYTALFMCSQRTEPTGRVTVRRGGGLNLNAPGVARGESNLTDAQWRNAMLLSQLRQGLTYYYREKKVPARTRAELSGLLGEETSAWQNKELAGIFEEFIRTHRIEEKKSPAPLAP